MATMKSRRGIVRIGVAALLIAASAYFSAYLVLVRRVPVNYGGNKLRQITLSVGAWRAAQASKEYLATPGAPQLIEYQQPPVDDAPDSYRPAYRIEGSNVETFFSPAHWIDSILRPNFWPPYDRQRHYAC
jgi:hypothetical protein